MSAVLSAPVLALNRHFAPLRVLDVKRAVGMLFTGAAEVVDTDDAHFQTYDFVSWRELSTLKAEFEHDQHDWIGMVKGHLAVPRVIRMMHFDRHRRVRVPLSRRNIYLRDGNTCQYCGKKFPTSELSLDHVIPRSRGGESSWTNLVCACTNCNSKKAAKTPSEARMHLIRAPRKIAAPAQLIRVQHESWAHFVSEAYWNVELQ
jgi:5-methylcytosine-specific restriction endonuclease McrA